MRAGFTLLELLVVVLIITILGAVVGVQLADEPHKARVAAATAQLRFSLVRMLTARLCG